LSGGKLIGLNQSTKMGRQNSFKVDIELNSVIFCSLTHLNAAFFDFPSKLNPSSNRNAFISL